MKKRGNRRLADKLGHIEAALDGASEVGAAARPGALLFQHLRFLPRALPDVALEEIDLGLTLFGKAISAPLMVSPMTGGIKRGADLNRRMAAAAERAQIPFGLGSQRVALEVPRRARDFQVRDVAPTIPIFANLGAVQLVNGYGPAEVLRAAEMVEADAVYLHLNAMQEVVQEGGDTRWRGVLQAIGQVCTALAQRSVRLPVFVREVGFGIPADDARRLLEAGVAGLDCAGGGGTSWTLIEGRVAKGASARGLGARFAAWGLSTPESILEVRRAAPFVPLIASGGLRSGLDVARAVALGATLGGLAAPVLRAAAKSERAVDLLLAELKAELRATLFGVGAKDLSTFRASPRLLPIQHWAYTPPA